MLPAAALRGLAKGMSPSFLLLFVKAREISFVHQYLGPHFEKRRDGARKGILGRLVQRQRHRANGAKHW